MNREVSRIDTINSIKDFECIIPGDMFETGVVEILNKNNEPELVNSKVKIDLKESITKYKVSDFSIEYLRLTGQLDKLKECRLNGFAQFNMSDIVNNVNSIIRNNQIVNEENHSEEQPKEE